MKEIPLSQGKVALVDNEDYESLVQFKWYAWYNQAGNWYAVRNRYEEGKPLREYMHQRVLETNGTDHIDGNGLNNQRGNLRTATSGQNRMNQRVRSDNRSGYKGVTFIEKRGKWRARIRQEGKSVYLGYFDSPIKAACAYDDAALRVFGAYSKLNFPGREVFYG
jgi:hypothetical protein